MSRTNPAHTAPPTIGALVTLAAERLAAAGFETPRLDAEVLLRHVLGLDRTGLFLRHGDSPSPGECDRFEALLARRLEREPVAYLTGEREFMGLSFAVAPGVLIPRPETEILVEWARDWLRDRPAATVLDIGTGSGAIAVSLAAHLPAGNRPRIVASDLSEVALAIARRNRAALPRSAPVSLVRGDLASWCGGTVDLILANLPYLRPDQHRGNADLAAEPVLALVGGDDSLDLIRRLLSDAPRLLAPNGAIGLEIDPSQATETIALGRAALPHMAWSVLPDLAGHPRHVIGT